MKIREIRVSNMQSQIERAQTFDVANDSVSSRTLNNREIRERVSRPSFFRRSFAGAQTRAYAFATFVFARARTRRRRRAIRLSGTIVYALYARCNSAGRDAGRRALNSLDVHARARARAYTCLLRRRARKGSPRTSLCRSAKAPPPADLRATERRVNGL